MTRKQKSKSLKGNQSTKGVVGKHREFWVIQENRVLFRSTFRSAVKCFVWHYGSGEIVKVRATKNVTWMTARRMESSQK